MKSFLYKLGTHTAVTLTMLLLAFAPFGTLMAQAQTAADTAQSFITPASSGGIGGASNQNTFSSGSDANILQQSATANIPSSASTQNPNAFSASGGTTYTPSSNQVSAANGGTGSSASTPLPPSSTAPSDSVFDSCGIKAFSVSGCVLAFIYAFTIGIGSVFAYVAAYFFDITIQLSLNGASYGLDFISTSWTTARDLGNMAFLFILLYIAFTIIFKADTSSTKTMLATVIIVALLVNFSFFFTRVVIDAGNILSIQFYNAIPAPPISQTIQGSPVAATVSSAASVAGVSGSTKDLTAGVMNMLNIQGLLNNNSFASTNGNFIATVFIYIAGAIVLWILTVAFITNGIKFLFRVVVLWFLIVASPLALISLAVPGLSGYFGKWRGMLVENAFYPVAFMFVFLILNNFAVTMSSSNGLVGGVFTTLQASTAGTQTWSAIGAALVSLFIRLALVIGVLYVAMQASNRFSVAGSKAAGTAGSWFGSKFIGAYGAAGRGTIGHLAYNASQSERFQNAAAKNSFVRGLWRGTNSVAKSSFDIRAPLKAAGVKDFAGVSLGDANKGGYKGSLDAKVKRTEAEAKEFSGLSDKQKEAAKAAAEGKYAAANATITTQTSSATAGIAEADRLQKEAQIRLQAAKEKEAEFTAKENASKTEVAEAEQKEKDAERVIQDHRDNGKTGTPEMLDAQRKRDEAHTEVVKAQAKVDAVQKDKAPHTEAREKVEKEIEGHKTSRQEFNAKIQDLTKRRKEISEDIKKDTKEEEKNRTLKNVYADSIGKRGWGNISRLGAWIPAADKKAAKKIRTEKSSKDKIADAVKDLEKEENAGKEEKKEEPAATAKTGDKKDEHH